MNKSTRTAAIALGGIAVLGAAWAGASIHAGRVAADSLKSLAAQPGEGASYTIAAAQHDAGLFASAGSFEVRFGEHCEAPGTAGRAALKVDYRLSHTVLPGSTIRFEWTAVPTGEVGAMLVKLTNGALRAEGQGTVSWSRELRSSVAMPELVLGSGPQALRVSAGSGQVTASGNALGMQWKTERIAGRGAGKALEVLNVALEVDLKDRVRGTGSTVLSIDRVGTGFGTLEGFRLATEAVERGDRTDVTITPSLRSVDAPGQKARDLSMQVAVRDIHTASLETIQRIGNDSCGFRSLKPEEAQKLRAAVRTALTGGLSLGIANVKGTVGDGSLEGFLKVELKKAGQAVAAAGTEPVAIDLANLLVSSGELVLKGNAVTAQQREMAVGMGLATEVPGGVRAAFEYADGLFKANGRVFDAGPFQVALSGADRRLNTFLGVARPVREVPGPAPAAEATPIAEAAPGAPLASTAAVRTVPVAPAAAVPNAMPPNAANAVPPNVANSAGPVKAPSAPNTANVVNSANAR